jgi:two-component system, chemotaxis family, response regulator Rcp1
MNLANLIKQFGGAGELMEILLVEDSPGDVRLTQEAFREANGTVRLHVASDGVEAMAFLKRSGTHANEPRPDLILLDLNLPRMNGREVLARIKGDDSLKTIPTIVLTTSTAQSDIALAYRLNANCYISKPSLPDALDRIVDTINDFWLTKAKLPLEAMAI